MNTKEIYDLNRRGNTVAMALPVSSHHHIDQMEDNLKKLHKKMESDGRYRIPEDRFKAEIL